MSRYQLSDRQHAERVGVDHKTVGSVRSDLEGRGETPHVDSRMSCVIDGCDSTRIEGRGLCSSHYNMAWRAGRIEEYDLDPQATFPPVDFCRCPDPQPVPVRLWGHVVVPGVFECGGCGRGFDPAAYEAVELAERGEA